MSAIIQLAKESGNDEFYPTPPELIQKMLSKVADWNYVNTALEPSAGKGDLIQGLRKDRVDVDAIEIDPELRAVLKGKGYRVVHDDFLTFRTYKHYDLIFANFPFGQGAKHFLKALQIQKENGGAIIALINAETLRNAYTNERKLLCEKLKMYGAEIEYLPGAFKNAERRTDVEAALVTVSIAPKSEPSLIFERLKKAHDDEFTPEQSSRDEVIFSDYIKAAVSQYNLEIKLGLKLISEWRALEPYILRELESEGRKVSYNAPILELKVKENGRDTIDNDYIKQTRMKYWRALFNNPKFTARLTSNLQNELYNRVSELRDYEFSEFNIMEIQAELWRNTAKGVDDTVMALFEKLTSEHSWYPETKKNIHYYNGWASNKAHKINKKVILPINGFSSWSYGRNKHSFESYQVAGTIDDMLKTIDYLTGRAGIEHDVKSTLDNRVRGENFRNIEFDYFTVDFFKKGTAHIKFKSQEIVDMLNIYGARKRNWLPPYYGKVNYDEMPDEAKAVIDEFQGKEKYAEVMRNKKLYLFEADEAMPLLMAENA